MMSSGEHVKQTSCAPHRENRERNDVNARPMVVGCHLPPFGALASSRIPHVVHMLSTCCPHVVHMLSTGCLSVDDLLTLAM